MSFNVFFPESQELPGGDRTGSTYHPEPSLLTPNTEDNVTTPSFVEAAQYRECSANSMPSDLVEPRQKKSRRRRSGFIRPVEHNNPSPSVDGEYCVVML